ncbi:MAG TPA: beta-ketoacyl-ACP synthase II [Miltoncostaeaceae bacterium]|nr:beta-ketoacyl-ACP synthase II [Miltoncostaeaceae bacterium]
MSAANGHPSRARVAVTGIGVVSPLGIGREEMWRSVSEGRSGAGLITLFDASDWPVRMACEAHGFDPSDFMDRRVARRMDRYAQFAVAAARMAVADAGLPIDRDGEGIGAIIANGGSGPASREEQHAVLLERGPDRVSPFAIPLSVANMGAGQVSMELGLHGPVTAICNACAAGTDAIGTALDVLRRGDARAMLAGGADATITPYFLAGFDAMRVLSHHNDDPAGAARPFDRDRDGFLVGEAGAVLVLEPLDEARARGAEVICEIAGYGATADAYHITDPDPTGEPQARAVTAAIEDAGVAPEDIDHVNAHGGASQPGDPTEVRALQLALGEEAAARVAVSATKSMHGHCMGATGALEAAITALALREGVVPPTINLHDLDPACGGVDHVANAARPADLRVAMSTSFGLGGHNSALVMTRAADGEA